MYDIHDSPISCIAPMMSNVESRHELRDSETRCTALGKQLVHCKVILPQIFPIWLVTSYEPSHFLDFATPFPFHLHLLVELVKHRPQYPELCFT